MFYSRYLKEEKRVQPTGIKSPPTTPRSLSHHSTGRWGGLGRRDVKKGNNFRPLKYRDGKKTVHFSTIEVQHFHFDWSAVDDCFYNRKELAAMGSARFDDAALLRKERQLDAPSNGNESTMAASQDDLDIQLKNKPKSISALLELALSDKDENNTTSIRGIEHFVYPDLQQEMIYKKKEVQAQVMAFVKSKRPDPQGWRLANHSRMYSQWAREVAADKGRAYRMHDGLDEPLSGAASPTLSLRSLTCSASFSASSYLESDVVVGPTNDSSASGDDIQRQASDSASINPTNKELPDNEGEEYNDTVGITGHKLRELRVKVDEYDNRNSDLSISMSDETEPRSQSAGAGTDEA